MAQEINTTSVSLNSTDNPAQYFADYSAISTSQLPAICALPPAVTLELPAVELIPLAPNCVFQFPDVTIVPPVYVPEPFIPFACPSVHASSSVNISGNAVRGSLVLSSGGSGGNGGCGVSLNGDIKVDACPNVTAVTNVKFPRSTSSTLALEANACGLTLTGVIDTGLTLDYIANTIIYDFPNLFPTGAGGGGGGGANCFMEVNTDRPSADNQWTQNDRLKVKPGQFETDDGDQWPTNMVTGLELLLNAPSGALGYVYLQLTTRPDYTVSSGTIVQSDKKLRSTGSTHNHLLAKVTTKQVTKPGPGSGNSVKKIDKIANDCTPPPKNFVVDCPFHMTDATGIASNSPMVRIRSTSVWDVYPYGMSASEYYYHPLENAANGTKYYMYLLSHTLPNGALDVDGWGEYVMEIKSVKQPKTLADNSAALRWEQFGTVTIGIIPSGYSDGGGIYCKKIVNFCSLQDPSSPNHSSPFIPNDICPFAITNASGSTTAQKSLKIRVNRGTIPTASSDPDKKYPHGMSEDRPYMELLVPDGAYWYGVYLAINLFDNYTIDDANIVLLKAEDTPRSNSYLVYELIGEISIDGNGVVTTKSKCPGIPSSYEVDCPFHISDGGGGSIRIRSTKVMGTYPKNMEDMKKDSGAFYLNAESGWNAVYLKMHLADNGYLAKKTFREDVMQIVVLQDYVYEEGNTGYLRWELLGEVTISDDPYGTTYCSYIQNSCNMPSLPLPSRNSCPFQVYDASELDPQTGKLKLKYGVAKGTVNAVEATKKYPVGMEEGEYFVRDISTNLGDWFAVYLVLVLYKDFSIKSASIEEWDRYKVSTDTMIYHLIAEVNISNANGSAYGEYISFIQNSCTAPKEDYKFNDCPFYIINAGPNSIRIKGTSVNGVYPLNMEEDTIESTGFYLTVTDEKPHVYLKINKTFQGKIDTKNYPESALEIDMWKDYKTAEDYNALVQWEYLGSAYKATSAGDEDYTEVSNQCGYPQVYSTPVDCAYKAFDISEPNDNGALQLRVRIRGTQLIDTNGEPLWPEEMSEETPWTDIQPRDSQGPWTIVYLVLTLNYKYEITKAEIKDFNNYKRNTASLRYHPIAEITVSEDDAGGKYISSLVNNCIEPQSSYNDETCPFYLQDDSSGAVAGVRVANTWVYNRQTYPDEMSDTTMYTLDLGQSPWYGIYLRVQVDGDGMINKGTDTPLTLSAEDTPKTGGSNKPVSNDTIFKKYFFLGEVNIEEDGDGNRYCGFVRNNCVFPEFPIDTGNTSNCPFGVTGVAKGDDWQIKIAYGEVQGVTPENMSTAEDYLIAWKDGTVVMEVTFKDQSVDIDKITFTIKTDQQDIVNTDTEAYYAIARLDTYNDGDGEPAPNITNYCYMPNPCVCDLVYKASTN